MSVRSTSPAGAAPRGGGAATADRRTWISALLASLVALAAIGGAWSFQVFGGYVPCALCLEQRISYYVGIPMIVAGGLLAARVRSSLVARVLLVAAAAVFAYSFVVGIYQSGAEWSFWAGPSDCGGGDASVASAGNLLAAMKSTRIVSCTDAAGRFLGLSFAGWNVVATGAVIVLCLWGAFSPRYRRSA